MKRTIVLILFILFLFAIQCHAEVYCETPIEELLPQIRIGETIFSDVSAMPDSGIYWKVRPLTAQTVFKYDDDTSLDLTYRYFNGDYRVVEISLSCDDTFIDGYSGPITCPGDIIPGFTTYEQLTANADNLNLSDIQDNSAFISVNLEYSGVDYVVWFARQGERYVCNRIYISTNTADLEKTLGTECTDYTIADFRELKIFESGYDDITAAYPGFVPDMVDYTHTTMSVKSIIYTLSDRTHLTLEFMETDGQWKLAGVCWIPENENALGIAPNPDDGKKYSKAMYAESLDWLTIGSTTFSEVDKRYFDHWRYGISQDSIDFQIQDENGNSIDLFFMSYGGERVLYAMRYSEMFDSRVRPEANSEY